MSCMFIDMYLGCIKCNIDIDCGNVTILKYLKRLNFLTRHKLDFIYHNNLMHVNTNRLKYY
jgi:hypothetical protein